MWRRRGCASFWLRHGGALGGRGVAVPRWLARFPPGAVGEAMAGTRYCAFRQELEGKDGKKGKGGKLLNKFFVVFQGHLAKGGKSL